MIALYAPPAKRVPLAIIDGSRNNWSIAFDDDGRSGAAEPVCAPTLESEDALRRYARLLLESRRLNCAIVIIDRDASGEPKTQVTIADSLPVYVVSVPIAVAEILETSERRFVHLEIGLDVSATLFMRGESGLVRAGEPVRFSSDEGLEPVHRFLDFAMSLGYERIVSTREYDVAGVFPEWPLRIDQDARHTVISNHRLHAAARAVARRGFDGEGVFITNEEPAGLRMTVARLQSFRVQHAAEPVFALDNAMLSTALDGRECVVFIDKMVAAIYGKDLVAYARERLNCLDIVEVCATEHFKTIDGVQNACESAMRSGIRRDGIFVACGGGVLLDTIGTAASIYRRGMGYFRIPTTLVGMIDVCVGIKQGVNHLGRKNLLGSFHAPIGGINDRSFLASVSRTEISAGFAEIIKVAMLLDPTLFELLEASGANLLEGKFQVPERAANEVLLRAEFAMMRELQPNLWEGELRRIVDFGHTFSSIIETESNYEVTHGHAVALDMLVSTAIAVVLDLCPHELLLRLARLFRQTNLPLGHELCSMGLLRAVAPMRLHRAGNLNLVVPLGLGRASFLQDVEPTTLRRALRMIQNASLDVSA